MKTIEGLYKYLEERAAWYGVENDMTKEELLNLFEQGVRKFFGITINTQGNMLSDD